MCLNNLRVPLKANRLEFEDLHKVLEDKDFAEEEDFLALNLSSTGDVRFLENALGLTSQWWRSNGHGVPLMIEIREALQQGKPKTGSAVRLPRRHKIVVALKVRNHTILAMNQSLGINLVFEIGTEQGQLQWFLEELTKDLEGISEEPQKKMPRVRKQPEDEEPSQNQNSDEDEEKTEKSIRDSVVRRVLAHEGCLRCSFPVSRDCFKLMDKQRNSKEFFVPDIKRKRKEFIQRQDDQSFNSLQEQYEKAYERMIEFLDRAHVQDSSNPSSSSKATGI